jgi:hypothetical protein
MSPPISTMVRERVIQLHREGKGRNEITEFLNLSHIRISQGSVTNILRAYKSNTDQASTKAACPSQLQTSSTSMKEEDQVPVSEGGQEPLSIEDTKGPEQKASEEKQTTHEEVQSTEDQESFMDSWSMIFEQVMQAKKELRERTLLIEQKEKDLEQQKRQIDRAKYELEVREARCLEVEPYLPVARRLQDLKIGLEESIPWFETIAEKAEAERIDQRTAAYRVASELRFYRQFAGIRKAIGQARQQLSVLDMLTAQKQQALSMLMNLLAKGLTEAEIMNLLDFADRRNKQWGGLGDGNGDNVNGSNNGWFSLNDLKLDSELHIHRKVSRQRTSD